VTIQRIAIVAHTGKKQAIAMEPELAEWLEDNGMEVSEKDPDLVVSLGGDGTMLRAAQVAHASDALLLGVNFGALGYLTEVEGGEERRALEKVFSDDFEVEERMMLQCTIEPSSDPTSDPLVALNEVLVERSSRARLVRLGVSIGGERLADFNADGVIVATPTGSTAYALSAGGPFVSPRAQCLVLVPVSAHMIFSRPFVLAPDDSIEIHVDPGGEEASLAVDGFMDRELPAGSKLVVCRHPRPLRLVRVSGPGFIERLRNKLGLPG
jgi:NAD+ kinase